MKIYKTLLESIKCQDPISINTGYGKNKNDRIELPCGQCSNCIKEQRRLDKISKIKFKYSIT